MFEQKKRQKKEQPEEIFEEISKKLEAQGFHFYGTANTHESRYDKESKKFLVDQEVRTKEEIIESYKNKSEFNEIPKEKIIIELAKRESSVGAYYVFVKILE